MTGIKVNPPPQIRLPAAFAKDKGISTYFRHLDRMLLQLWTRTGGGNDLVDEIQIGELYEPGIETVDIDSLQDVPDESLVHDLLERVEGLEARIDQPSTDNLVELIDIGTSVTVFTTTGSQVIICNNTGALTITLNTLPDDGERLTIIRRDASVSLVGTLNGSTPTALPSKFDILDVYFTLSAGEWSA